MGRKVNPIGFRLAVRRDWRSRWYARGRDFADLVVKDAEIRRHIRDNYVAANISLVEIERTFSNVRVIVHAARPGVIIGKKGEGIDALRDKLRKMADLKDVLVDIKEVAQADSNAKIIALNIASQLERRIMFRRAMRRAMAGAMRLGVNGIKIMCAGRLNGIEIARTEWQREGRVPLHTLRNDVDYGMAEAKTNMGVVGVKVWVSHGDSGARKQAKYTAVSKDAPEEESVVAPEEASETPEAKFAEIPESEDAVAADSSGSDEQAGDKEPVAADALAEKKSASADKKPAVPKSTAKPAVKKSPPKPVEKVAAKKSATAKKSAAKPAAKKSAPAAKKPAPKKPKK